MMTLSFLPPLSSHFPRAPPSLILDLNQLPPPRLLHHRLQPSPYLKVEPSSDPFLRLSKKSLISAEIPLLWFSSSSPNSLVLPSLPFVDRCVLLCLESSLHHKAAWSIQITYRLLYVISRTGWAYQTSIPSLSIIWLKNAQLIPPEQCLQNGKGLRGSCIMRYFEAKMILPLCAHCFSYLL